MTQTPKKKPAKQELAKIESDFGQIAPLDEEKGKYTLVTDSPISSKQILRIFQRTPEEHKNKRPAKGGGTWDYVTGVYVKKVLNYTFGWLWDFQIIDKGREGDQVWVQGRLTIKNPKTLNPLIIKEQFGAADIKFMKGTDKPLNYGNDLKAAATDALKKCAAELGIASDVYGKNEFKEIRAEMVKKNIEDTPNVQEDKIDIYRSELESSRHIEELNKRWADLPVEAKQNPTLKKICKVMQDKLKIVS